MACGNVARFTAIEEHRGRVSLGIQQTAGLADRFRKRQPPGPEWNLLLRADRTERQEGLRLPIQIDRIVGMHVDIVDRLINQRAKGGDGALAASLQEHPGFSAGSPGRASDRHQAGPADDVEHALGRGGRGNPRRASLAQDADHGRLLFDHGHNDLRLDRAVLEGRDNGVLHLDLGASARADGTRIGDRDVAVDVDGLVRNGDEIARPDARLRPE